MAHGNYDCCALCDGGMSFSYDGRTKETLCADCAVAFFEATGEKVTTGDALAAWLRKVGPDAVDILDRIGFTACCYGNDVDKAYRDALIAPRPAGEERDDGA